MTTAQWLLMFHVTGAFFLVGGRSLAGVLNVLSQRAERPSEIALSSRLIRDRPARDRDRRRSRRSSSGSGSCTSCSFSFWQLLDRRRDRPVAARRGALGGAGGEHAGARPQARRAARRRRTTARRRTARDPSRPAAATRCRGSHGSPRCCSSSDDLETGPVIADSRPFLPLFLHVLGAMTLVGALLARARPDRRRLAAPGSGGTSAGGVRTLLIVAIPAWIVMRVGARVDLTRRSSARRGATTRLGSASASPSPTPDCSSCCVTSGVAFWWNRPARPAGRARRRPLGLYLVLLGRRLARHVRQVVLNRLQNLYGRGGSFLVNGE